MIGNHFWEWGIVSPWLLWLRERRSGLEGPANPGNEGESTGNEGTGGILRVLPHLCSSQPLFPGITERWRPGEALENVPPTPDPSRAIQRFPGISRDLIHVPPLSLSARCHRRSRGHLSLPTWKKKGKKEMNLQEFWAEIPSMCREFFGSLPVVREVIPGKGDPGGI